MAAILCLVKNLHDIYTANGVVKKVFPPIDFLPPE
jgi:hypothetical protein